MVQTILRCVKFQKNYVKYTRLFKRRMTLEELHLKEGRKQCWGARDKYWKCLDSNNEILEKCVKLRKEYEKFCSQQWVKHFDRKRQFEKFKEEMDKNNWEKPI